MELPKDYTVRSTLTIGIKFPSLEIFFFNSEVSTCIQQLVNEINAKLECKVFFFNWRPQEIINNMSIWVISNKRISLPIFQITSLLDYAAKRDNNSFYYNYFYILLWDSSFSFNFSSGISLIFVYIDIFTAKLFDMQKSHCYV